jgi:hypothetical protein
MLKKTKLEKLFKLLTGGENPEALWWFMSVYGICPAIDVKDENDIRKEEK